MLVRWSYGGDGDRVAICSISACAPFGLTVAYAVLPPVRCAVACYGPLVPEIDPDYTDASVSPADLERCSPMWLLETLGANVPPTLVLKAVHRPTAAQVRHRCVRRAGVGAGRAGAAHRSRDGPPRVRRARRRRPLARDGAGDARLPHGIISGRSSDGRGKHQAATAHGGRHGRGRFDVVGWAERLPAHVRARPRYAAAHVRPARSASSRRPAWHRPS